MPWPNENAYKVQPSPYSGDENPLSGPLIGPGSSIGGIDSVYRRDVDGSYRQEIGADFRGAIPGFDFRGVVDEESGVAPLTLEDLERIRKAAKAAPLMPAVEVEHTGPILATPRRFISRFRTRRHA